jgi:hypothetical protein
MPRPEPLGYACACGMGRTDGTSMHRHRPHTTNKWRRRLLWCLAWCPPWCFTWRGRHPRLCRHRPHACRGVSLSQLAARQRGGHGLRPLPRRPRSSSTAPLTIVTSSPAPTPPREGSLKVWATASIKLATIFIHAQGVFDEISHLHRTTTASEQAPASEQALEFTS